MKLQQVVPLRAGHRSDFKIQCDGCTLSATWATHLLSEDIKRNLPNAELLFVKGQETPSGNLKYLPALRGVLLATASGWAGPLIVWSSGNFALSVKIILKKMGLRNRLVAGVSSNLPAAKRQLLENEGIELITEEQLRQALGGNFSGSALELLDEYARRKGMRVVDQYNCDWNWSAYVQIPEQIFPQIGPVSAFAATPGTKGKYNGVGMALRQYYRRTAIALVYPENGLFPGGRNRKTIKEVKNKFLVRPTKIVDVSEENAYRRAALLCPDIACGITGAAEVEGLEDFFREMYKNRSAKELELDNGSIVGLVVGSDGITPYIQEGGKRFPELYSQVEALLH